MPIFPSNLDWTRIGEKVIGCCLHTPSRRQAGEDDVEKAESCNILSGMENNGSISLGWKDRCSARLQEHKPWSFGKLANDYYMPNLKISGAMTSCQNLGNDPTFELIIQRL